MRDDLDALLDDTTLTTLLLAIAIGWSLYQFAHGVGTLIDGLLTHLLPSANDSFSYPISGGALTWVVGHRLVTLDAAFIGAIELAIAVAAAVFVQRRRVDRQELRFEDGSDPLAASP
jgi:hypothetical protein